jgi:hypothetical protein
LHPFDLILARSSDDDWIKVVFGIIVAVIWGLGALVSAVNKKAEEAKRRQRYARLPQDATAPTSPRALGAGFPSQQPQTARTKQQKKQRQPKRRPVVVPTPPVPAVPVYAAPAVAAPAATTQPARNAIAAAAAPPASRIARLVRRSDSLRAAIILNEILAPPPGLWESGSHRRNVY